MARNYRKADYAANKMNKESIVYLTTDGSVEVTLNDFLKANPNLTEQDFSWWKKWSDDEYKVTDRKDSVEAKHTVSIYSLEETEAVSISSAEEIALENIRKENEKLYTLEDAEKVLSCLTETQRRRYLMREMYGMTFRAIAHVEGDDHMVVKRSIDDAEKKIKKFLKRF